MTTIPKMPSKIKVILLLFLLGFQCHNIFAQAVKIVSSKELQKQLQSMEVGPWDFAPDWYYWALHQKYSGASLEWKWSGFHSGFKIKFKEPKSNVKTIMPTRVMEVAEQKLRVNLVKKQEEDIKPLWEEEMLNSADRNIDSSYSLYKNYYNDLQNQIQDGLLFCVKHSKGKMTPAVTKLQNENQVICENIAYLHKTGVGYELENAKRQEGYEKSLSQMKKLLARVTNLAKYTRCHY